MRIEYDQEVDAAYVYIVDEIPAGSVARLDAPVAVPAFWDKALTTRREEAAQALRACVRTGD